MKPFKRLSEVFDRGLSIGFEGLSPSDRELFLIQDFIIEFEMNSLSGYLYNRLPELKRIVATVAAMRHYGMTQLAELLEEAADLFRGYVDPDPPTTWEVVQRQYDPSGLLQAIHKRIGALDDYGLDSSTIE